MDQERRRAGIETTKTIEAKQLMMELETKTGRARVLGLVMLFFVCIGVIIAVILASVIFNRQAADRRDEAKRREAQAEVGNAVLQDIYHRLNHTDELISKHVGVEPLPPLVVPTTTTTPRRRATTTTTVRRATTTTSPPVATTSSPPTSTTTTTTTTTTQPQTPPTTRPETCVGVVCVRQ